jgi:hypothetical protein
MLAGVDHVQLAAPPGSEDLLRGYYVDVLGMTEIPKPPVLAARGGCWFRTGAVQLHLGIEDDFGPRGRRTPDYGSRTSRRTPPGWRRAAPRSCGTRDCRGGGGSTRTTPWATGWSSWFDRDGPGHPQ